MTSPDPMKECCPCCLKIEGEYFDAVSYCQQSDCECHNPSPAGWERELYEKWKAQHPDVLHAYDSSNETPHEWWVRNYVETRLLPYLAHRDAALVEKVEGKRLEFYENEYEKGWDDALDAVISLITNREKV